jgi:hypothetical protein
MRFVNVAIVILVVCLLTIVTQIGGLIFLISLSSFGLINESIDKKWLRVITKFFAFAVLYVLCALLIVPLAARPFGRVPLPMSEDRNLKPANFLTGLLNRNYVRPQLRETAYRVAADLNLRYPGATLNYLDANFPFFDKFPLFPHLSHNDGNKLDVSFQYNDAATGEITDDVPSFIGYGICEEPGSGEEDKPKSCQAKGYWQYSFLRTLVSQDNKKDFVFDNDRNRYLINTFTAQTSIRKIFIEPHLKTRLGLTSSKIRFHGCQAVRHDDHIHVQLR